MVKIKICGLFREEDIEYANEAGPDFIGFVFAPSRRQVGAAEAARLRRRLAPGIIPVGVFTRAPPEEIIRCYRDGLIDIAQLHGGEDNAYIRRIRELSAGTGRGPIPVIRAMRVETASILRKGFASIPEDGDGPPPDYLLFDQGGGGTGKAFDWTLLGPEPGSPGGAAGGPCRPWFLAGGICGDNLDRALSFAPFGIDVSSGAETGGVKDRIKMIELVKRTRGEEP
jgi:phosphoribosylanthranilate isomerase